MIPDSLDFILRPVADEQAEYAATHQTPAPMTEGEAGFGAGQTPASPTVPLGEAGPHSSDADAVGAPASEGPRDLVYVGGRVGEAPIYWGCDVTAYVKGQHGTLRGHDWITPERLRGVFVRLDHPETGRMDGGDMLYIEVGAEPFGETGRLREIISSRVVDRDQFDRMTGITDLRRDLGWRD